MSNELPKIRKHRASNEATGSVKILNNIDALSSQEDRKVDLPVHKMDRTTILMGIGWEDGYSNANSALSAYAHIDAYGSVDDGNTYFPLTKRASERKQIHGDDYLRVDYDVSNLTNLRVIPAITRDGYSELDGYVIETAGVFGSHIDLWAVSSFPGQPAVMEAEINTLDQICGFPDDNAIISLNYDGLATIKLAPNCRYRLCSTTDCYFAIGNKEKLDLAAASGVYLPANTPEIYQTLKEKYQITVVQKTTAGTLNIVRMIKQ